MYIYNSLALHACNPKVIYSYRVNNPLCDDYDIEYCIVRLQLDDDIEDQN